MRMNPDRPTSTSQPANPWFTTTHWSVILAARDSQSPRSREALESLCRSYWYPLYSFARRTDHSAADAEDLTQGFFARLLEKDYLKAAAQDKGRFRTFMLVAFKRYLANEWDRQHSQKRGGFSAAVLIDQEEAESRFAAEAAHHLSPDLLFDRQWAMTLLDRTMAQLRQEYVSSERAALFDYVRPCVVREESALPYAEIGERLKLSEAAIKMAVQRLRGRYREILRREIAQTVASEEEIDAEIRHLFSTFSS
jgi:RNA polymerase sigma factor (sigma-70 family)